MSEVHKVLHLILPYLSGTVLDLGSRGMPVIDHAIQMDLHRFRNAPSPPVQMVGDAFAPLPFKDNTIDAVVASHILEDALNWNPILAEWRRVIRVGGRLIILVPDHERFRAAVESGANSENLAHKHESYVGELSTYINSGVHFRVITDRFEPADSYNILGIFQKYD